jgi:hypothetical protein
MYVSTRGKIEDPCFSSDSTCIEIEPRVSRNWFGISPTPLTKGTVTNIRSDTWSWIIETIADNDVGTYTAISRIFQPIHVWISYSIYSTIPRPSIR